MREGRSHEHNKVQVKACAVTCVLVFFEKVGALKTLAPTQKEPPFLIAQLVVLVLFVGLAVLAVKGFHPESPRTA